MATDNSIYIATKMEPFDVSGIQDPGVQALVLLAVTLGWGVRQKPGNPVVLIADDGMQKRLPTDSSIRISVFQQALSTIMTHTEDYVMPTIELIDEIIAATKPSADHQRRLRLALGETPQQHRERVENSVTPKHRPDPRQEHLMQNIEIPEVEPEWAVSGPPEPEPATHVPADGEDHGEVLTRAPTIAKRSARGRKAVFYESDTSYKRHWEDGYIDFECMMCGKAYSTSRGVGGHSQIHDKDRGEPAWKRSGLLDQDEIPQPEPSSEWEEPDDGRSSGWIPSDHPVEEEPSTAQHTLDKVIQLVVPTILRERDNLRLIVDELRAENAELRAVNEKLGRDWGALKELIGGST